MKKYNQSNRRSDSRNTVQLTTVYYPDQISSYRTFDKNTFVSTTPTNFNFNRSEYLLPTATNEYYEIDESYSNTNEDVKPLSLRSDEDYFHPPNHRKRYIDKFDSYPLEIDDDPEPFDYFVKAEKPSAFKLPKNMGRAKVVFPRSQPIVASSNMNNIRDILDQASGDSKPNGDLSYAPSIQRARGIRIEGTYRRLKGHDVMDEDSLSSLSSTQSIQKMPAYHMGAKEKSVKDVFSRFKPPSPSDVNTLASSTSYLRPTFYRHNRPRPVTEPQNPFKDYTIGASPQYQNYGGDFSDPETLYNQVIMANNNRFKSIGKNSRIEKLQKNQKPFSLMLDVYPVADDEPSAKRPHLFPAKRPILPINVNAINQNLPYVHEHSYYNHMKFPQLQNYRMPDYQNYYNSMYFRNFLTNRQNGLANPMAITSTPQLNASPVNENTPSQITVHLNLFPNKKLARQGNKQRNVEVLDNRNSAAVGEDFHDRQLHEIHVPENRIDMKNVTFKQIDHRSQHDILQHVQSLLPVQYSNVQHANSFNPNLRPRYFGEMDDYTNSSHSDLQFSEDAPQNITFPISETVSTTNQNDNNALQTLVTPTQNNFRYRTDNTPLQSIASTFAYSSPDVEENSHLSRNGVAYHGIPGGNGNSFEQRLEAFDSAVNNRTLNTSFEVQQQQVLTLA